MELSPTDRMHIKHFPTSTNRSTDHGLPKAFQPKTWFSSAILPVSHAAIAVIATPTPARR